MRLGSVGGVKEENRSDLDSHAYCCFCGKEVLISMILTVRSPSLVGIKEGETQSLRIVSAALGYMIPDSGKTVLLIVHQSILSPTLNHNLFSTMKLRLHDVIVNETRFFNI
jgi:hypothetical protein